MHIKLEYRARWITVIALCGVCALWWSAQRSPATDAMVDDGELLGVATEPMRPTGDGGFYAIAEVIGVCTRSDMVPIYVLQIAGTSRTARVLLDRTPGDALPREDSLDWWVGNRFLVRLRYSQVVSDSGATSGVFGCEGCCSVYIPHHLNKAGYIGIRDLRFRDFENRGAPPFEGMTVVGMAPIDDTSTLDDIAAQGWPETDPARGARSLYREPPWVRVAIVTPDRGRLYWKPHVSDGRVDDLPPVPPDAELYARYVFVQLPGAAPRLVGRAPLLTDAFVAEHMMAAGWNPVGNGFAPRPHAIRMSSL